MLHFPCEGCYVPLKTLVVGALCQLCSAESDVAMLAMHLNLAPALLRAASSDVSTVYLKVNDGICNGAAVYDARVTNAAMMLRLSSKSYLPLQQARIHGKQYPTCGRCYLPAPYTQVRFRLSQ